jgi:hypothetical protein
MPQNLWPLQRSDLDDYPPENYGKVMQGQKKRLPVRIKLHTLVTTSGEHAVVTRKVCRGMGAK